MAKAEYGALSKLDGSHPFKSAVPGGFVDYQARRRSKGSVVFFNFALARELGLIPADHRDRLDAELEEKILETFCFQIINEYDRLHPQSIRREAILPNSYMATRYLQIQHPGTRGWTSGDGRSVWIGTIRNKGVTWDISSCGTGVTCLCPATGQQKIFFESGGTAADYGCGTATVEEGIGAAITSEIFHSNGIATERVLAVIETIDGQSINVRAGRNLLRPAHMFLYLRQNDLRSLTAVVDLFIERQIANGDWPRELRRDWDTRAGREARYAFLAEQMARTFAALSATFESEYIFCWLEWDGDNILANGGIVDYGSIRQFGLYHRDYRFDDGPRLSTSLPEQKRKARHIVQSFAQLRDYLIHGKKSCRSSYRRDPILELFGETFRTRCRELLLRNIGFTNREARVALTESSAHLEEFRRAHRYFERARARRGPHRTADGFSHDAIYSTRDLLRELPAHYVESPAPIDPKRFMEICASDYASAADARLTPYRRRMASAFQRRYLALVSDVAARTGQKPERLLRELKRRSAIINRGDRVTGDALTHATAELVRNRKSMSKLSLYQIIQRYVALQVQDPDRSAKPEQQRSRLHSRSAKKILDELLDLQVAFRYGL